MDNERVIAIQSQEKFQYYLIALVFTILGLSIQTYTSSPYKLANSIEVFSWGALLISGLFGLSYLEWGSVIREKIAIESELEEILSYLRQMMSSGITEVYVEQYSQRMPIKSRIQEVESHKSSMTTLIEGLENKSQFKYQIFKWAFGVGIIGLVLARAYAPVVKIICAK